MADDFALALARANHFQALELALRWQVAVPMLVATNAGAARLALNQVVNLLGIYHEAWVEHLPASRWDPDFGDEHRRAHETLRALPDEAPTAGLPSWMLDALERRYQSAVATAVAVAGAAQATGEPPSDLERAVARVLALVCTVAGQAGLAVTLETWAGPAA